jgi:hypothetical protein
MQLRLRVLDVRARPLHWPPDPRELLPHPYCVLRLGALHHRSITFPPTGMLGVASRLTLDREQMLSDGADDASQVQWEVAAPAVPEAVWSVPADAVLLSERSSSSSSAQMQEAAVGVDVIAEVYDDVTIAGADVPLQLFEPVQLCTLHVPLRELCSTEVSVFVHTSLAMLRHNRLSSIRRSSHPSCQFAISCV